MLRRPSESFFYRKRYGLAFIFLAIVLCSFICFDFMRLPLGLSQTEINSLIASSHFVFPGAIVDFLYHALQRVSIMLFGISLFSLRLPSVILAILSAVFIVVTLKRFYRSSTALSAGLITISSTLFLSTAHSGSPMIMAIFLLSSSLFAISKYLENQKIRWLFLTLLTLIIVSYSPLGIYFLLFGFLVTIFNKKLRRIFLAKKVYWIILFILTTLIGLAPLALAIYYEPSILLKLLGLETIFSANFNLSDILVNLGLIFLPSSENFSLITPIFDLVGLSIAIIGLLVVLRQIKTPRAISLLMFSLLLLILAALDKNNGYILLLPAIFLVAAGIDFLIQNWYGFFPKNPVARLLGMLPLLILTLGVMSASYNRFIDSNFYDSNLVYAQNYNYIAVRDAIQKRSAHNINLVVSQEEKPLYETLRHNYHDLNISEDFSKEKNTINIVLPSSFNKTDKIPSKIVAGWTKKNSELLRIYAN